MTPTTKPFPRTGLSIAGKVLQHLCREESGYRPEEDREPDEQTGFKIEPARGLLEQRNSRGDLGAEDINQHRPDHDRRDIPQQRQQGGEMESTASRNAVGNKACLEPHPLDAMTPGLRE